MPPGDVWLVEIEKGEAVILRREDEVANLAWNSLSRLVAWIEKSPQVTPDPLDFKSLPWFVRRLASRDRFFSKLALKAAYVAVGLFPLATRRFLGIRPQQTAGAAAWLARGYLELFRLTKNPDHLRAAELWLARLQELRLNSYQEYCWDWPYDWHTKFLVPAHTPFSYDSWIAGQTIFDHFELTAKVKSLEMALSACRGILKIFQRVVDDERHLCIGYSSIDRLQVFNVNALVGGLLCRVGHVANQTEILRSGQRMLNWVADNQMRDGSWGYFFDVPNQRQLRIDHYHTAMLLQGLAQGSHVAAQPNWIGALERGIRFYLDALFAPGGRPKDSPSRAYPVDAMACAESLILFAKIASYDTPLPASLRVEMRERCNQLLMWTCKRMQSRAGHFYYLLYPGVRLKLYSHRWGQGAMLVALACVLRGTCSIGSVADGEWPG